MDREERVRLFDDWAKRYDQSDPEEGGFPRAGYERVLDEIARTAEAESDMSVLDLGIGTGNLAARFSALGCRIWGIDFSREMLLRAREKLPLAVLSQADLLDEWPAELARRFDRIVSAYVLHEFDLPAKVNLLRKLAEDQLAPGGCIVVGDVAFPTSQAQNLAHETWAGLWDEEEHYWSADETADACRAAGLRVMYEQVSICGGVFTFRPAHSP